MKREDLLLFFITNLQENDGWIKTVLMPKVDAYVRAERETCACVAENHIVVPEIDEGAEIALRQRAASAAAIRALSEDGESSI